MKRIIFIVASLLITGISLGQSITEVYMPRYIQAGTSANKVPYVCRVTVNNLDPNKTYRYYNRFVAPADTAATSTAAGLGLHILVNAATGTFTRVSTTTSLLSIAGRYGEFTTDAAGSYTGWFVTETSAGSAFILGNETYFRLYLNDGNNGTTVQKRVSASNSPVKVISFAAATTANSGSNIRSTPATNGVAGNFVMLYDNAAGTGRPISGAVIESDGVANTTANGYAAFYVNNVEGVNKAWGAIIPNANLATGVQRIVQYKLSDGSTAGSNASATGDWAKPGGGTVSTVNTNGVDEIVIDGAAVPLTPPAPQTISFTAPGAKTYGDADFNPGAIATSGLPVVYSSSNPAVADTVRVNGVLYFTIKGAGTTDITASQPGNTDNAAAPAVMHTLTVAKANLTIAADRKFWLQGTAMPALTITYTGFVNGDDASDLNPQPTISTTATGSSPLGDYPIDVNGAVSPNYNITHVNNILTIQASKQTQSITFNALPNKLYGAADYSPGAVAGSALPVTYVSSNPAVATIVNGNIHIVGVGTTTITASQGGDNNYEAAQDVTQQLTVDKAPLTITAQNKTKLVSQPNPTFTVTYSGFVRGETNNDLLTQPIVSTNAGPNPAPGIYVIEVSGATSNNYDIRYVFGELKVDGLPTQTITFGALPVKKYGDPEFSLTAKATSGLRVVYRSSNTGVAIIVRDTIVQIVGAGTTVITASQPGDANNGPAQNVQQTLTVQKVTLTVRADNKTRNEGEANPPFTISYTGFVNNDDSSKLTTLPTATTTATAASLPGAYRISVQGAASNSYNLNYQPGILTILPGQGDAQDNVNAYISAPGQLQVNVYAVNVVKVSVQLFDLNGSRVANTTVTLNKGFNTYRIPVGNLSRGIYNLRVAGGDVLLKTKIVIQ